MNVPRYGRWSAPFPAALGVERVAITAPDGTVETRPAFAHQPAELRYDHHGYESLHPSGEVVTVARFTPTQVGTYRYRALRGAESVEEGSFVCTASNHPGYVEISRRDPRYFACSDGSAFCPTGVCLVGPPFYPLPKGMEHFSTGDERATLGAFEYRRWFRLLAENGANFVRLWLSNAYFNVEMETAGEVDLAAFARLDRVVELAREYGIRLKLCVDHFRTFEPGTPFFKALEHPADGRRPASVDEWLQDPSWRALWLKKVAAYMARYAGDPTVAVWELWNEMDCVRGQWELVREWTRDMLRALKEMAPRQLVVNSLGSYDDQRKQRVQDDFRMAEMDFQQVHRYLDQGAPWEVCTLDPVRFSIEAIIQTRRHDRPVLLAETGAVNDRHTGPFRFYRMDERGIIFHDTTFPAFFAGAVGTGQIWHWEQYVDQKDLWGQLRPFADLLAGVEVDKEALQPVDFSTPQAWLLGLLGQRHLLLWVRNKADSWHAVLRDEVTPVPVPAQTLNLAPVGLRAGLASVYSAWPGEGGAVTLAGGQLRLPTFKYGLMIRVALSDAA
jgi:hypothetical protein